MFRDQHSTDTSSRQSSHLHDVQNVQSLLQHLKSELDPIHSKDTELHQLWLEIEWLQSNLRWDRLCLPTTWELFVFRIERGDMFRLRNYPSIVSTSKQLAIALRNLVPPCN